jgi:S-DNA-T family DNA segregation ATPase FtsK/SpoIIIE
MAKKKRTKQKAKKSKEESSPRFDIHPDAKRSILGVVFIAGALILFLSYLNLGGILGAYTYSVLSFLFGVGFFVLPILFFALALVFFLSDRTNVYFSTLFGALLFFLAFLAMLEVVSEDRTGGAVGAIIASPLNKLFGFWGALVLLLAVFIVGFIIAFNFSFRRRSKLEEEDLIEEEEKPELVKEKVSLLKKVSERITKSTPDKIEEISPESYVAKQDKAEVASKPSIELDKFKPENGTTLFYELPSADLLEKAKGSPSAGDVKAYSNIIKRTLEHFNIPVEMDEISIGPTVTRYTLKPAQGVKLSKITALHNDLALALAAHPIRIEAPIPGRSLVGIEVPNRAVALVRLRELVDNEEFLSASSPLAFPLGFDVAGVPIFADLTRMPHLLVAGATGSGKSVCIHSIITSFLFRNYPQMLRFIIIDPKRVELAVYRDIPHLLTPPITEGRKAINALRWAVKEMERRYEVLSEASSRDIVTFNNDILNSKKSDNGELMPYLVIIIDELADLMAAYTREVESSVVRLAQMARAVGIHLLIATQRPSVEVLTGLIKANITSRIAFQVASQIDSRTILDSAGAERLLGNGDMLFLSSEMSKPRRIQSSFISEKEVKNVVDYLKKASKGEEIPDLSFEEAVNPIDTFSDESELEDNLFEDARELVIQSQKASASFLQRRLKVGYARAARLLDMLEDAGVIGPGEGAKPRDVFVKPEGYGQEYEEN